MMEGLLRLNASDYNAKALADLHREHAASPYGEALGFMHDWINGTERFLLQTSGSTGMPKKLWVSRQQMEASAKKTLSFFNLSPSDAMLCPLATQYIGGRMMLVRAMLRQSPLSIIPPQANPFVFAIDAGLPPPAFTALVPYQLGNIIKVQESLDYLNQCGRLIVGGAPLPAELATQLPLVASCPIYQTYGMTETVSHIALREIAPNPAEAYTALAAVKLGVDERQCLNICADATDNALVQTNDVVQLVDESHFIWQGRADFVINSGGVKIFPEKLEEALAPVLSQLGLAARQYLVGGVSHEKLGQEVILIIEGEPLAGVSIETIRSSLGNIPAYQQPRQLRYLKDFTFTASGKLDRRKTVSAVARQMD